MIGLSDAALLAGHAATTWALVGLIWTVQLVHYPLFAQVGGETFAQYHADHTRRITWIVAPAMTVEALLAFLLLARPVAAIPAWAPLVGAVLVALVWATTALVHVPLHARLARGATPRVHARLVRTNWIRTAAWSARGLLAAWMFVAHVDGGRGP